MIDLTNIKKIALVGASNNKEKYGYKIMKDLLKKGFEMYPVNPKDEEVVGVKTYKKVSDLPKEVQLIVFVVPSKIGINSAKEAYENGFKKLWFQPGAESEEIKKYVESIDVEYSFIDCIMVEANI